MGTEEAGSLLVSHRFFDRLQVGGTDAESVHEGIDFLG
jgi:hypothetical protein